MSQTSSRPVVQCERPTCGRAAMLDRMPNQTSAYHIHRLCFGCAVRYYNATARVVARTALRCWRSDNQKIRRGRRG